MPVGERILKMNQIKADEKLEDALYEITKKEPAALNKDEKAFLRARRTYLTKEQKETFKEVLNEKPEPKDGETGNDPVAELAKKQRKDLDKLAEEMGLNPKDYQNKDEIAAAIIEAQSE